MSAMALASSMALSEERGRGRKSEPPVVSSGNLTPFGKRERAIEFEDLAAAKMAFEIEMIVDRGVDGGEFLQGLYVPELRHRSFSSVERLVGIFGSIVEPTVGQLGIDTLTGAVAGIRS